MCLHPCRGGLLKDVTPVTNLSVIFMYIIPINLVVHQAGFFKLDLDGIISLACCQFPILDEEKLYVRISLGKSMYMCIFIMSVIIYTYIC